MVAAVAALYFPSESGRMTDRILPPPPPQSPRLLTLWGVHSSQSSPTDTTLALLLLLAAITAETARPREFASDDDARPSVRVRRRTHFFASRQRVTSHHQRSRPFAPRARSSVVVAGRGRVSPGVAAATVQWNKIDRRPQ